MSRFAKMLLLASLVFGIFAVAAPDDAEAGWGCWRGRSYVSSCYNTYRPYVYSSYCAPRVYSSYCYTPSYNYCGYGYNNFCGYRTNNCFYGGYGGYGYGGFGGYNNCFYGGYGGYGGYTVPTCYGQFNW